MSFFVWMTQIWLRYCWKTRILETMKTNILLISQIDVQCEILTIADVESNKTMTNARDDHLNQRSQVLTHHQTLIMGLYSYFLTRVKDPKYLRWMRTHNYKRKFHAAKCMLCNIVSKMLFHCFQNSSHKTLKQLDFSHLQILIKHSQSLKDGFKIYLSFLMRGMKVALDMDLGSMEVDVNMTKFL